MNTHPQQHQWFQQSRFGMFLHWGPYSVGARGEWLANRERIPKAEYTRKYVDPFQAESYDPDAWAELAKEAGMGYAVLTTRHHDGFALWPTECDDYHAGRLGPKKDLVAPFVDAFRAAGLKIGFYYSPASWFHPDYPGAHYRDWPGTEDWKDEASRLRFIEYYRAQLRELMTRYGKIDYLWYDGCIPSNLQSREANEDVLRLQPDILINERNGAPFHVHISEQTISVPDEPGVLWEACMTLNQSWGYHAGDHHWKDAAEVIRLLTETAAGAGNLLLNIGPRADGSIPQTSEDILKRVGKWMQGNRASVEDSDPCDISWSQWGRVTSRENRLYLHVWNDTGSELCFAEVKNRVLAARILSTGLNIPFDQQEDRLFLRNLPQKTAEDLTLTIELELDGKPECLTEQTSFWIPG